MNAFEENPFKENINIYQLPSKRAMLYFARLFFILSAIVFIFTILFSYFFESSLIEGESMQPTVNSQWSTDNPTFRDSALYSTYISPKRGDIIIVTLPDNKSGIKRLIALGNDTIYITNNQIYVNNEAIEEPYLQNYNLNEITQERFNYFCEINDDEYDWIEYSDTLATYIMTIPADYIFFLGDNRPVSNDCSSYGPQPYSKYEGTVVMVAPYGYSILSYIWHNICQFLG